MKTCNCCHKDKEESDFYLDRGKSRVVCKTCEKEKRKAFYYKNIDRMKIESAIIRKNPEHRNRAKQRSAKWRLENPERSRTKVKECFSRNRAKYNEKSRLKENHKREDVKAYQKKYKQENKTKINAALQKRHKERFRLDPLYKTKVVIRARMYPFKNNLTKRTREILGCTWPEFMVHIQSQFKDGMNWNNHGRGDGKWQFDHKIPLASCKTQEDILRLCHYSNIQPLWAFENILKGAKIIL